MRAWLSSLALVVACSSSDAPPKRRYPNGMIEVVLTTGGVFVATDDARRALGREVEVDAIAWEQERALLVRTGLEPPDAAARERAVAALDVPAGSARWAGDRLFVRTAAPLSEARCRDALARAGLELIAYESFPDDGTGEVRTTVTIAGQAQQLEHAVERALHIDATVVRIESVGSKGMH